MDPNSNTPTPPPEPQAAPAPQPSAPAVIAPAAPAFTQAQVDALIADAKKQAHDAAYAQARRTFESKAPNGASPPAPQSNPQPSAPAAGVMTPQDIVRVTAFTAATMEHGIPAAGVEVLLDRFMAARPADPRAWVSEQAAAFGWNKPATPSTPAAGSPALPVTPTPSPAPATPTPSGSPPASSAGVYDLKPSQMKKADVDAYVAKHGPRAFKDLVRNELAGTRVTAPPRR